jgi:hypothetical protein
MTKAPKDDEISSLAARAARSSGDVTTITSKGQEEDGILVVVPVGWERRRGRRCDALALAAGMPA